MFQQHNDFAARLAVTLLDIDQGFRADLGHTGKVQIRDQGNKWFDMNLTPFAAEPQVVDAKSYFSVVKSIEELLQAYAEARRDKPFEAEIHQAHDHVSAYASQFMTNIFKRARNFISDSDACRIAALVSNLDLYTAVKSVESLLNSRADLVLLKVAEQNNWTLHFDHLALRCGCAGRGDAERVVENLCLHHGYVHSQLSSENYYKFADGWDAYVLYKVLENGQQLRLFIDQSSEAGSLQIIQHWNYVYGYTAHHLALRASRVVGGMRMAVPLPELISMMQNHSIEVLAATGQYTVGLLQQAFTQPELNTDIPESIRQHLREFDASLESTIENGKLLELISRSEIPIALKPEYFALYGLTFDNNNPLHSAPVYPYFLPAQAAHVIRTSVQTSNNHA